MNMIMRVLAYCFAIFAFSAHNALAQTDRANCEAGDIPVIIYYPSGQSTLPNSAREVIGNVVDTIKLCSVERVIVEGHADRTGLKSTNLILSKNRAARVEAALRRRGLNAAFYIRSGKGEQAQAIQTPDNVSEPLNRRTEILIQLK